MEEVILDEVNKLTGLLSSQHKKSSTTLNHNLSVGVVNSIWTLLTGMKINQGDETVNEIVAGTDDFIKNESLSGPIMMLPWLMNFPGLRQKFQASRSGPLKMRQFQIKTVEQMENAMMNNNDKDVKNFYNDNISNNGFSMNNDLNDDLNNEEEEKPSVFIDTYLRKIAATSDKESSFYGENGRLNLQRSLTDLFGAGSETSSSMLLVRLPVHDQVPRDSGQGSG